MTSRAIPKVLSFHDASDVAFDRLRARRRATDALMMSGSGRLWAASGLARADAAGCAWFALAIALLEFGVRARQLPRDDPAPAGLPPVDLAAAPAPVVRTGNISAPSAIRWPAAPPRRRHRS